MQRDVENDNRLFSSLVNVKIRSLHLVKSVSKPYTLVRFRSYAGQFIFYGNQTQRYKKGDIVDVDYYWLPEEDKQEVYITAMKSIIHNKCV